jgi:hypothetical protein
MTWRFVPLAALLLSRVLVAETMPILQQNALVHKYCAVCHTDAARSGGLTLERFDAAQAPPSLTAIMLSKLTGGVSLKTAQDAAHDPSAAALIDQKVKSGAMGASGIPRPDKATVDALILAFIAQSAGATNWTVEQSPTMLTASILREAVSSNDAREAESYRLIASCDLRTKQGHLQLTWSPVPQSGSFTTTVDGSTILKHRIEGTDKAASAMLEKISRLPSTSLTITDLFPRESVTFPFSDLHPGVKLDMAACFSYAN